MFLENNKIDDIREELYHKNGFYIFKNFFDEKTLKLIKNNWLSKSIEYEFQDFIKNRNVTPGTPKYMYNKPTKDDFAYCTHIWNEPVDELLHSESLKVQILRNQLEGKPIYSGLHESTGRALQYRVCRTVSSLSAVNRHADFFEEYRPDPAADHSFDPSRLQATLFLSDYDKDYKDGGFKLWNEEKTSYKLFGKDVSVHSGDLVIWRYSLPHEVSDIQSINREVGFMRIIFPLFDTYPKGE